MGPFYDPARRFAVPGLLDSEQPEWGSRPPGLLSDERWKDQTPEWGSKPPGLLSDYWDNYNFSQVAQKQQPKPTSAPKLEAHTQAFFDRFYGPGKELADEMGVPVELILGLAVAEGGWAVADHPNHNVFGLGAPTRIFETPGDAMDAWRKSWWFERLKGKTTLDEFMAELAKKEGRYLPYDEVYRNPNKIGGIRDRFEAVRRRLPIWLQGQEPR